MKLALLYVIVFVSSITFSQGKYERRCTEVISILSDSSLTMKSYYVDFNGKYHYFDKIISAELNEYKLNSNYRDFYILKGGSLYSLDDSWTSICYYEIEEDSAFFAQKIIYAPTFMSLDTGGRIRDKYWLGEGGLAELRKDDKKNKKLHKRAQKREVVYSDSTGSNMILRHIPPSGGGSFDSFSGSSSGPVNSGSFNGYSSNGGNSNSSSYAYEIIMDSTRIGIAYCAIYSIAKKDLAKRYKIYHDKILEVLKPNQELFDLFVEEYERSFDSVLHEESLKKGNKLYYTISYTDIFQHIMDKYYRDYLVRFKVQN